MVLLPAALPVLPVYITGRREVLCASVCTLKDQYLNIYFASVSAILTPGVVQTEFALLVRCIRLGASITAEMLHVGNRESGNQSITSLHTQVEGA